MAHPTIPSPLEGEDAFQFEQKPANIRKAGEGYRISKTIICLENSHTLRDNRTTPQKKDSLLGSLFFILLR